ncbi:hypothetical protein D9619_006916 [Psilocybe cf. subviscida]|uniref:Uncharacterized protein n=1 Tax=Psilocybe cf. subviscida TaxID=2480587 RepID=A0A8H5EY88_9AGAR|nr:hypothetical protein D9619_006916 [Psilocybe cf. subviscida]
MLSPPRVNLQYRYRLLQHLRLPPHSRPSGDTHEIGFTQPCCASFRHLGNIGALCSSSSPTPLSRYPLSSPPSHSKSSRSLHPHSQQHHQYTEPSAVHYRERSSPPPFLGPVVFEVFCQSEFEITASRNAKVAAYSATTVILHSLSRCGLTPTAPVIGTSPMSLGRDTNLLRVS